jgi:hypothetical protein
MDARAVLRSPDLDRTLREDGIVATPLLAPEEVEALAERYRCLVPEDEAGLQNDLVRDDRELVRALAESAGRVVGPAVDRLFVDHEPVLVAHIVKHGGPETAFYLHRDIAVNDPRAMPSFTLWIPLVDVGQDLPNGGLAVVPGSHRLPTGEHGYDASVLIDPYRTTLLDLLEPIDLPAGHALVYDARLLHGSGPNLTATTRVALGCMIARRSEPMIHVVPTGRRHRRLYAIDRDFFLDHVPSEVVAGGMPARYSVVDEFDDDVDLPPETVAQVFGLDGPPATEVTVPSDLVGDGEALGRLPVRRLSGAVVEADVVLDPSELDEVGDAVAGVEVVDRVGSVSARTLRRGGRRVAGAPSAVAAAARSAGGLRTRELAILVVAPMARVTLRADGRRGTATELRVVDGPMVRAGARTADAACRLDPGWAVPVEPDVPVTVWNEGPGPLVLLVRRSLSRRRPPPSG